MLISKQFIFIVLLKDIVYQYLWNAFTYPHRSVWVLPLSEQLVCVVDGHVYRDPHLVNELRINDDGHQ